MLLPWKGAQTPKCTAPEKVNVRFFRELRGGFHGRCMNDNRRLGKNRNTHKQQEQNSVKIYFSTILNKNRK